MRCLLLRQLALVGVFLCCSADNATVLLDASDVFPHAHMGIGGVSAGATSRLLIDYDPKTL